MENTKQIDSPVEGLAVRLEWAYTEMPDFSHYGRFIAAPHKARDDERVVKNPLAWHGDEQVDFRRHGYFAVSAEHFDYDVRCIYPHADDSAAHDAAVGAVTDRWERIAQRIADGEMTFIDVRVVVSVKSEVLGGQQEVDIGVSETICEYEVNDDETNEDAAAACAADNGLVDGAIANAERVLATLRNLANNVIGGA